MGPSFSLEIVNLATKEVRSVLINAGWTDESAAVYRRWCDCGAAGYFNRGSVDRDGTFVDSTEERHELRASEYVKSQGCDHSKMSRFEIRRAKLQGGGTVEIASQSAKGVES
jgi:hypothetical protein